MQTYALCHVLRGYALKRLLTLSTQFPEPRRLVPFLRTNMQLIGAGCDAYTYLLALEQYIAVNNHPIEILDILVRHAADASRLEESPRFAYLEGCLRILLANSSYVETATSFLALAEEEQYLWMLPAANETHFSALLFIFSCLNTFAQNECSSAFEAVLLLTRENAARYEFYQVENRNKVTCAGFFLQTTGFSVYSDYLEDFLELLQQRFTLFNYNSASAVVERIIGLVGTAFLKKKYEQLIHMAAAHSYRLRKTIQEETELEEWE